MNTDVIKGVISKCQYCGNETPLIKVDEDCTYYCTSCGHITYYGTRDIPKEGEQWLHFKGNVYSIIGICKNCSNESDGEMYVIYKRFFDNGEIYIRRLTEFMSKVDKDKYPQFSSIEYRFTKLNIQGD